MIDFGASDFHKNLWSLVFHPAHAFEKRLQALEALSQGS